MYKQFIFDVDGTLVDTNKPILLGIQETWEEKTGEKRSLEEFHFSIGIPGHKILEKLGYHESYVDFGRAWAEKIRSHADLIKVFDGVREVMEKLKSQGAHLSVVTSRTKGELKEIFDGFQLWPYFDYTVTADMTHRHKPDPEPLLKLLELSGTKAKEAIYIGDTEHDMACAKGAGMDSALALWGLLKDSQIQATHRLKHPKEILTLWKGL